MARIIKVLHETDGTWYLVQLDDTGRTVWYTEEEYEELKHEI